MPAPSNSDQLTAVIGFSLPNSRLDHDPSIYLTYDPKVTRPSEYIRVPVRDLRPEIVTNDSQQAKDDIRTKGYALVKHQSEFVDDIPTEEGTEKYLTECTELLKELLGCTRVIAWNSVVRMNDPDNVSLKDVPKQPGPEKGFVPTSRIQPIAGLAHTDQDNTWGKELCGKAIGQPADSFERVMIVNIWRPLKGPVTNAPLAVASFPSIAPEDMSRQASMFGIGLHMHHAARQDWGYIRHQNPDEICYLKCYDSHQGKDGSALYCGHVAVKVDGDEEGIAPELLRPRESIEVRLVAMWE